MRNRLQSAHLPALLALFYVRGCLVHGLQHLGYVFLAFLAGMAVVPISSRLMEGRLAPRAFGLLGRAAAAPFQMAAWLFGKMFLLRKAEPAPAVADCHDDGRERRINDSVHAIKDLLLVLGAAIDRANRAAADSSVVLADARVALKVMRLPPELASTASDLVAQIDRVVDSNSTLKGELATSQKTLNSQQQVIEKLRSAAHLDGMTQVANRAHFDEKLSEILNLKHQGTDASFLMLIDVDNFKTVNDTYGHQAGDRILKGVAFRLKDSLRESDFVARFGGDEFAVILEKVSLQTASRLAWKLRDSVGGGRFLLDGNEIKVTVSIGATEALAGDTVEVVLRRADSGLYQVKENGRDGVQFVDPR